MEKEENVYVETDGTEVSATAKTEDGKEDSAVPEKFKDVSALVRAYESLQAEFTRRSQRLKALEKQAREAESQSKAASGVEKLRKNAEARRAETRAFDEFIEKATSVAPCGEAEKTEEKREPLTAATDGGVGEAVETDLAAFSKESTGAEDTVQTGSERETSNVVESADEEEASKALYTQVCENENVRLRIIGEYLSSMGKGGAPLTALGRGTLAAPPLKPRNIHDAGDMALQYFKMPKNG
ncbi:MAG: hypothetical protein IJF44_03245 [Clostridia bacterium]|nr:hypothetical protein [Clostridia bacterium]